MLWALRSRFAVALVVAGSLAVLTGCGSSRATPPSTAGGTVVTQDYLPGLAADVHLPTGVRAAPVVVLVPGGAWLTADRRGLTPLARSLAAAGIVAVNMTYRAVGTGGRYPEPVQDVACAVAFAVQRARDAGLVTGPVVVLGHSAGGHLAALAALGAGHFTGTCPYPRVRIDGLIGLAGTYDVSKLSDLAQPLFGRRPAQDPAAWREGNPMSWVDQGAQSANLKILLAHGTSDADLPSSFTDDFGAALRAHGYDVRVDAIQGATHQTLYSAAVIGPVAAAWVLSLPGAHPGQGQPSAS